MFDGRYFAWLELISPASRLIPQVITNPAEFEAEIARLKQIHNPHQTFVIKKHVLCVDEYDLSLDDLIAKYPAPRTWLRNSSM